MSRSPIKLAIFENSTTVRDSLRTMLGLAGDCLCLGAWGGVDEADASLNWAQLDVVLMDIRASHRQAIPEIRRRAPHAQIVLLTVYEDIDVLFESLQRGACGYLLKRSRPEQILAAIREVHTGGGLMTSAMARKLIHFFGASPSRLTAERLPDEDSAILKSLANGVVHETIARRLNLKADDVKRRVRDVYEKLHRLSDPANSVKNAGAAALPRA